MIYLYLMWAATLPAFSQSTLCEENSVLYSNCYTLNADGTFSFRYSGCGQVELARGTFIKKGKSIRFHFDEMEIPQIEINKSRLDTLANRLLIHVFFLEDGEPSPFTKIDYNGKTYETDWSGRRELDYTGGTITVYSLYGSSTTIDPKSGDDNFYEIRFPTPGPIFLKGGTTIEMKRKGEKYLLKEKLQQDGRSKTRKVLYSFR
ncbi:hypothetical protein [Flavobacterium silvaticum]|uniref:Uncharacterized protein n=1 Tax=Flavobacterium silvaticum TaxID=1852020 RepID=A0A972JF50_9FLAO|nr:hypothetical protein [Flavobacterium silvaticum]NMH27584.1 hypothetical protein [Flavobacterium silvaticum]